MRTRQWERGCGVIKRCSRPGGCIVAGRTLLREAGLHVIRVGRAIVVRQMTGRARSREARIYIVFMAGRTLRAMMRSSQRKRRRGVIKGYSRPGSRTVTG